MGAALTDKAQRLFGDLQQRLARNLPVWLSVFLPDIHSDLKDTLRELAAGQKNYHSAEEFATCDLEDVTSFANYHRNYAACWPAISRMINQFAMLVDELHNDDKVMLYASVKYANDWPAIVKETEVSGRGEGEKRLRGALRHLLAVYVQHNKVAIV
jgi:hypothetical protein